MQGYLLLVLARCAAQIQGVVWRGLSPRHTTTLDVARAAGQCEN